METSIDIKNILNNNINVLEITKPIIIIMSL